jgi:hypothetical protein
MARNKVWPQTATSKAHDLLTRWHNTAKQNKVSMVKLATWPDAKLLKLENIGPTRIAALRILLEGINGYADSSTCPYLNAVEPYKQAVWLAGWQWGLQHRRKKRNGARK